MALGADRINMLAMVLRSAFLQVGIGLAIGIPVTLISGRLMSSLLFGVKPYDPIILSITIIVLAVATFVASVIPQQEPRTRSLCWR